jgi:pyruvate/2-oxoglutarate dehydrogenase complex dihydrolipoamide dehydrogenase (E3) component
MSERIEADFCIVGAGSGGLNVAAATSQLGLATVLVEGHHMGGDCLNFGCVPSKALIAAGKAAVAGRSAAAFGIDYDPPRVDMARVRAHVREVVAAIEPHDSQARFEGMGVRVVRAPGRFVAPDRLGAGEFEIRAKRFCVATGSLPLVPKIEGLERVPYRTNLDIFELDRLPEHLLILGGGATGVELGQAFRRLGARVTIVEMARLLGREDPELVEVLRRSLGRDGVALREGAKAVAVEPGGSGIRIAIERDGAREILEGSDLLIAAGRRPAIEGLDLAAAGIEAGPAGIRIDRSCRTTNPRVYAIGDVTGGPQFTHWASHQARVLLRNVLFRLPTKCDERAFPRVTYADPELAQVGMTEAEARARGVAGLRIGRWPFAENDRADAERRTEGFIKVLADARGRVLGAGIVGARAGEVVHGWGLAIAAGIRLGKFAEMITAYPTFADVSKRVAAGMEASRLFGERSRALVRFLWRFA